MSELTEYMKALAQERRKYAELAGNSLMAQVNEFH